MQVKLPVISAKTDTIATTLVECIHARPVTFVPPPPVTFPNQDPVTLVTIAVTAPRKPTVPPVRTQPTAPVVSLFARPCRLVMVLWPPITLPTSVPVVTTRMSTSTVVVAPHVPPATNAPVALLVTSSPSVREATTRPSLVWMLALPALRVLIAKLPRVGPLLAPTVIIQQLANTSALNALPVCNALVRNNRRSPDAMMVTTA